MFGRIVLNIPHASPVFPFGRGGWEDGIQREVDRWTDWFTDWLFISEDPRTVAVAYPFSRFFCDVERLEDDPMEEVGQGIVYRRFNGLKRELEAGEETWTLTSYREHIGRLRRAVNEETLLIDCHSFPQDLSDVEICLGFNDDWSRPPRAVIEYVERHFIRAGYRVGLNSPYSNAVSPACDCRYRSLMVEVNKGVYMKGGAMMDRERAGFLRRTIREMYEGLLK